VISKFTIPALFPSLLSIIPLQPISQVIPEINKEASALAVASAMGSIAVAGIVSDSGSGDEQDARTNVAASSTVYFITLFFYKIKGGQEKDCAFCYKFAA
jgi:hypothetical protein